MEITKVNQGYCAKCGRKIVFEPKNFEWDGEELHYYYTCECGAAGSENYKVSYDNTTCIVDEQGQ